MNIVFIAMFAFSLLILPQVAKSQGQNGSCCQKENAVCGMNGQNFTKKEYHPNTGCGGDDDSGSIGGIIDDIIGTIFP